MTLCVAAECRRHNRFFNAIVFAADFQVEGQTARADIGVKICPVGRERFPVLMAGTQTRALELASEIHTALLKSHSPMGGEYEAPNWTGVLREAVLHQKYRIADEIVIGRFGISYREMLKVGRDKFPPDLYRDTIAEISRTPLDCWLLVLAFRQTDAIIFRISDTGIIETCQNFAAIGSGLYLAESALFQRDQSVAKDLGITIYNIFEAMRLGSRAPGVGDKFQIGIVEWEYWQDVATNEGSVKWSYLAIPAYYEYLEKKFQRYGPKRISAVKIRPRLIKEQQMSIVLTPKGESDPENIAAAKRAKAARDREARKRAAKQNSNVKSEEKK